MPRTFDVERGAPGGAAFEGEVDLHEVISESTAKHLISDVPVATFLSGGLDSSYLTALAARHQPGIAAYPIGFRPEDGKFEALPDALKYARPVAAEPVSTT